MTTKHPLEEAAKYLRRFMRNVGDMAAQSDADSVAVALGEASRGIEQRFEALERAVSRLEARPSSLSELVDASKLGPRRNCIPSIEVRPLSDEEAAQLVKDLDLAKGRESVSGNAPVADGAVVGGTEEAVRSPDPEPVVPELEPWEPAKATDDDCVLFVRAYSRAATEASVNQVIWTRSLEAHEHYSKQLAPLLSRAEAAERERDEAKKEHEDLFYRLMLTYAAHQNELAGDEAHMLTALSKHITTLTAERDELRRRVEELETERKESFEAAWAKKEVEGYQYGPDALENVRLGWDMAYGRVRAIYREWEDAENGNAERVQALTREIAELETELDVSREAFMRAIDEGLRSIGAPEASWSGDYAERVEQIVGAYHAECDEHAATKSRLAALESDVDVTDEEIVSIHVQEYGAANWDALPTVYREQAIRHDRAVLSLARSKRGGVSSDAPQPDDSPPPRRSVYQWPSVGVDGDGRLVGGPTRVEKGGDDGE